MVLQGRCICPAVEKEDIIREVLDGPIGKYTVLGALSTDRLPSVLTSLS